MSFQGYKETIEAGDTVILFFGYDCLLQIKVERNKVSQTRYGALRHSDLLGKQFGSKVHCSRGWVYALHPTPELWTVTLPHRTQILYSTDISMVVFQLDLKPGSVVIESGTGSGSLSHALIRAIAPTGHLYTFDFHEQRVAKAKEEFSDHKLGDLVTCTHRDVLNNGFGLEGVADAVFLDLPAPWEAVPFLKGSLKKKGGRVCSFSPCIEQVQKTCEKLQELGFLDIQTMECLTRQFDVRSVNMPLTDMGYGIGKYPDCEDNGGSVHKPEMGRMINEDILPIDDLVKDAPENPDVAAANNDIPSKMLKLENVEKGTSSGKKDKNYLKVKNKREIPSGPSFSFKSGLAPLTMPGHTGYLTFATVYSC